jgi:pyruvate dehydrogenase E1 component alpha subunit
LHMNQLHPMTTNLATDPLSNPDDLLQILRDDGSVDAAIDPHVPQQDLVLLYRSMVRVRAIDERLVGLQRQGRIGFHIGALGEEAAVLGSAYAMREQDFIFPCYREWGAALFRGLALQRYLDNAFGNANDLAKGRQMPDHITCRDAKFGSVSSPIGTQIAQAVGYAWAARIQTQDVAVLCYFGDGATSSNDFHSGLNFASVFQVPAVLLCRNNGWAISVPSERQSGSSTFAQKGHAYGVPHVRCDGNDLLAVIAATRAAVQRASRGQGPTLIEALTYRMSGHSTSDDPRVYRSDDALQAWRGRDPIVRLRAYLARKYGWEQTAEDALRAEIDEEMNRAIASAERTSAPTLQSMFEDVYAEPPWHLRAQLQQLLHGPRAAKHED